MALFNLKDIKKNVQKSAEGLRKTVSDAAENLPDSVKKINVGDSVQGMAKMGQSTFETMKAKGEEVLGSHLERTAKTEDAVKTALDNNCTKGRMLSTKDSLSLIYCLMSADGTITPEEEEKFLEIGTGLDSDFENYRDEIINEKVFKNNSAVMDEEDYFDAIHDYAAEIIYNAEDVREGIDAKTLIWDLLVMAYSEGEYSSTEKRLIRFICRALKVDSAITLEMEQTLRTILAINKEEEWLKTTDRPYIVIEKQINELKERRETILAGVHALMAD